MVGFEDSVNMAEECKDPVRDFPKMMLTGLGITGTIYVLVSITAVALVPVGDLTDPDKGQALTQVVAAGAPDLNFDTIFPFIGMFAVANSALINMLMASRLLYGLANQDVLPRTLGKVHPVRRTPWVAILFTTADLLRPDHLRGPGQRLRGRRGQRRPAGRHHGAAAALRLHRRQHRGAGAPPQPVDHEHFRAPTFLPYIGAVACFFLAGPWARTAEQREQYKIAGGLLVVGIVLWAMTWMTNRGIRAKKTGFRDIEHMEDDRQVA